MPRFDLTPTQQRALEALDWLHSQDDAARATGRTTVLVLNLLRRLILTQEARTHRSGWLPASDHVDEREMDRHLIREALRVAADCGFTGFEIHSSGAMIRIAPGSRITHALVEAISEFGVREEESLGIPVRERISSSRVLEPLASGVPSPPPEVRDQTRMIREMLQAGRRIESIERRPQTALSRPAKAEQPEPPPASSLWDHLTDADDD